MGKRVNARAKFRRNVQTFVQTHRKKGRFYMGPGGKRRVVQQGRSETR